MKTQTTDKQMGREFKHNPIRVGDEVRFANIAHYPSIHGKICVVTSLPDSDFRYYGIRFMDGYKMAVTPSEIGANK